MAVTGFLSGVESGMHFQHCVRAGVKHVLMSFLQFKNNDKGIVRARKKKYPDMKFMVDSGAFTFITKWEKYTDWKREDFQAYVEEYAEWLEENRQYIHTAVEYDIDHTLNMVLGGSINSTIGGSIVEGWQRDLFRPLVEKGLEVIFVWHENRGMDGWEDMCRRYSYVGMPGHYSTDAEKTNRHFSVAKRYLTKVHGFAASVTGDSVLILKNKAGVVTNPTIETLFQACPSKTETIAGEEWVATPSSSIMTWTLDDNLRPVFRPVRAVIKHRFKRALYTLYLRGGKRITGTGDHSFFTLSKEGKLLETKPVDMKLGDHLVASLGFPCDPQSTDVDMKPSDAEFMGVWFGDGYVSLTSAGEPHEIRVSKQTQPEIRSVCERMAQSCGRKWTVVPSMPNEGYFCAVSVARWIAQHFGRVGEDKKVGPMLLSQSLETQAAFLRGYFSTDGSCKGRNWSISLTCFKRQPLEICQLLLENFDIRSSISELISKDGRCINGGKPLSESVYYKLNISDLESFRNFQSQIGFLQADQSKILNEKITCRRNGVASFRRGLPVELLAEGKIHSRLTSGKIRTRKPYAKDKYVGRKHGNFAPIFDSMRCEYLEIVGIEKHPSAYVDVYDLEVPGEERFFANGILAHNTKQLDFRDVPWCSVDSITWKTGEMYGTLIVWDENKQQLIFEENKAERFRYKHIIDKAGFNSGIILADGDYKEVTRFGLWSMRQMEAFYARQYASRTPYYETRLPHWRVLQKAPAPVLNAWWTRLRSDIIFKDHVGQAPENLVHCLTGLSAAQSGDLQYLASNPKALDFLGKYFPKLISPLIQDPTVLQKEVASYVIPPNPPALLRTAPEHFIYTPPKMRDDEITPEDLAFKLYVDDM